MAKLDLLSISWPTLPFQQVNVLLILTATIAVFLVVFYRCTVKHTDGHRMPPGPRPWPIIGNMAQLGPLAHQDFQKLAKQYGPIFRLRLGWKEAIIVNSPRTSKEVLNTHDAAMASRPDGLSQFTILGYDSQSVVSAPYGPFWRYLRKVFTLEVLTNKRIQQFQNVRKEEVLGGVYSLLGECKSGKAVSLGPTLQYISMNNITRMMMNKAFFGPNLTATNLSEARMMAENIEEVLTLHGSFNLGDYIPLLKPFDLQGYEKRMRAVVRKLDKYLQRIIDDRRQRLVSSNQHTQANVIDIVDVLLTRSTGVGEKALTDKQIKSILMDIVTAGTGTSSVAVEWAMTELLRHPDVLKKAQDELDTVVGKHRLVEEEDISKLKYLRCIVKEAMRLHPPAPLTGPHECMESRNIAGYHIPEKCQLYVNVYAIGRDPDVWERPLEFYPERFLSTAIDVHGNHFQLLPFGSGRRMCPGKNVALVLVDYMLAVLLHACDWALPPGVNPQDVDTREAPGGVMHMVTSIKAIASPRLPMDIISADPKTPSSLLVAR